MTEPLTSERPRICYVSIPFGRKHNASGEPIDFDNVYQLGIRPAVEAAGLQPLRGDDDNSGILNKPRLSRLLTSDYCVFDLTTANPNVLYELGIRHTARANATILVFSNAFRIPFDLVLTRAIPYQLAGEQLSAEYAEQFKASLTSCLLDAMQSKTPDSPLFRLFDRFPGVNVAILKSAPEVFLSYAHADANRVQPIYERLKREGYKPWMDKFDIVPGEDWRRTIEIAIRRCDFFLALLSTNSSNRRGIIQTEFRDALEKAKEMLQSDIYLIPVRLEVCEVPDYFTERQWVDVFEDDGFSLLIKALSIGVQRRSDLSVSAK